MIESLLIILLLVSLVLVIDAGVVFAKVLRRKIKAEKKIESAIEEARRQAKKIIETARDQGLEILANAEINAGVERKKFKHSLDNISARNLRELNLILDGISKDIKVATMGEVKEFKEAMQLQVVDMQKEVTREMGEEKDRVAKEIEKYRDKRMLELDEQVYEIVKSVLLKVTARVIPIENHIRLVKQALEEAKKNVF